MAAVVAPVLQAYCVPPLAVSVTDCPRCMVVADALILAVGGVLSSLRVTLEVA